MSSDEINNLDTANLNTAKNLLQKLCGANGLNPAPKNEPEPTTPQL